MFTDLENATLARNFCFFLFFFVFFFAYGSSWARDWIWVAAVTYTEAAAMPDPLTHCTDQTCSSAVTQAAAIGFFLFLPFFRTAPEAYGRSQLGVELELQLLATATATATKDLSLVYNLYHSSRQRRITNPLIEARDWTRVLMDTSRIRFRWATTGTPWSWILNPLCHSRKSKLLCFCSLHLSDMTLKLLLLLLSIYLHHQTSSMWGKALRSGMYP